MRGCGKAIEPQLGGTAPPATCRSTWTSHAKVANDTNLSPIPRLNFNLRRMLDGGGLIKYQGSTGRADHLALMTCHDEATRSVAML